MIREMQLVISEDKQIIKTITKVTNTPNCVKSLQEFQQLVNSIITKIIEERGGSNQDDNEDLNEESSGDEEDAIPVTPKKRRK